MLPSLPAAAPGSSPGSLRSPAGSARPPSAPASTAGNPPIRSALKQQTPSTRTPSPRGQRPCVSGSTPASPLTSRAQSPRIGVPRRVGGRQQTLMSQAAMWAEYRLVEDLGRPGTDRSIERTGKVTKALTAWGPDDLEECVAGCYWRWMVHSLLADVATLKKGLDETQDELHSRQEEQLKLEQAKEQHERLQRELVGLEGDIRDFHVQVPQLREANRQLRTELDSLIATQTDLQDRKRHAREEIEAFSRRTRAADTKAYELDRKVQSGRSAEQDLQKKLQSCKDDVDKLNAALREAEEERETLAKQVKDLEAARKKRRRRKKGAKK